MQQIDTSQKQIQEQKTTVKGGAVGHWIIQLIWTGLFLVAVLVGVGILLWIKGGLVGQGIDASVVTLAVACGLWYLYQWGWRQHYKTKLLEFSTHFYSHPQMVIGDHTTREFTPFYVPQIPDAVKDEPEYIEAPPVPEKQLLSLEQARESRIWELYEQGYTYQKIVDAMKDSMLGEVTMHTVRKALGKTGKEQ